MDLVAGLALLALLLTLSVVLPVVSFVRARRASRVADDLRVRLDALERAVDRLTAGDGILARPPTPAESPAAPAATVREQAATVRDHAPTPTTGPPVPPAAQLPAVPTARPPAPAIAEPGVAAPATQSPDDDRSGLEQLIGGRWLLYAGIAAVVLGMSYFVKFAFDNGWISEPLRVLAGAATGAALVGAGLRFRARGLALFGQALMGGGVVVLYVSIYAALHFYALIAAAPAFGLMVIVTAGAAWLADRQHSQPLAALALLGGFATPLLVGGDPGAQVVLFTYIAILISGSAVIARRHAWPLLSAASYVCTFVLLLSWFFSAYDANHWLRTELFLTLYVSLFGYLLWAFLETGDRSPQAVLSAAALVTAPLVYHLASVILLNEHPGPWLIYLVLFTVTGLVVAQRTGAAPVRAVVILMVGLPALVWLQALPYPRWYAPALFTVVALYGLHLAAQWEAARVDGTKRRIPPIDVLHSQLNGLLLPLSLFVFLETRAAWWNPWMVALLAAWNAALAWIARGRAPEMTLQFIALSGTLGAIALVLAFDGPAVAVGWTAEGALVGWLALRERNRVLAIGSGVLIAMGALQLVSLLGTSLPVADPPILNARWLAASLVIGLLAWLAWRMRDDAAATVRAEARDAVIITANLLAIGLLSAEIRAFFSHRAVDASLIGEPMAVAAASLAQQMTLSVTWALYAVGLIAAGIRRRYRPARYLAIVVFAVTVLKVLVNDIAGLDRFYRMLSVLGVGVLLLVASYLYQRMAADTRDRGIG